MIDATSSRGPQPIRSIHTIQVIAAPQEGHFDHGVYRTGSVIVPDSSPYAFLSQPLTTTEGRSCNRQLGAIGEASSDSFEEEQVVTPLTGGIGKRKIKEEAPEDEVEKRREERAEAVAAGRRKKYAYNTGMVSQNSAGRTMLIIILGRR